MNITIAVNNLGKLLFPECCLICGRKTLPPEKEICLHCLHKLPRTHNYRQPGNRTETLLAGRFPFHRAAAFCIYSKQGMLQPLIHQLKYRHKKEIGILLGRLFGNDLAGSPFIQPVQIIVPVPLHPDKLKKRTYNQAEAIALGLAQSTSLPLSTGNLVRAIDTPTQTRQTKTQRWENVKDIFKLIHPERYAQKHILLTDDIITTGSTLEACAYALLKCPGIKISIATLGEVF